MACDIIIIINIIWIYSALFKTNSLAISIIRQCLVTWSISFNNLFDFEKTEDWFNYVCFLFCYMSVMTVMY